MDPKWKGIKLEAYGSHHKSGGLFLKTHSVIPLCSHLLPCHKRVSALGKDWKVSHFHSLSFLYTNSTWLHLENSALWVFWWVQHITRTQKCLTTESTLTCMVFQPQQEMTDNSRIKKFCFDFFKKESRTKLWGRLNVGPLSVRLTCLHAFLNESLSEPLWCPDPPRLPPGTSRTVRWQPMLVGLWEGNFTGTKTREVQSN